MSHPCKSVIAFRLLVWIASARIRCFGAHQTLKSFGNEKLMDAIWGSDVTASYRAWQISSLSPSLIAGIGRSAAARAPGDGIEAAESAGIGQAAAQASGIGKQTAQQMGVGKIVAEENFLGRKTAQENLAGQIAAREQGTGRLAAMKNGHGRELAIARRAGVHTAKAMGIGNSQPAGLASCSPAVNVTDAGWPDEFRGWFDIRGCGQCNDYCRWVGAASGGDPFSSQVQDAGFWSCHLSGSDDEYTPQNHFSRWMHPKCDGRGLKAPCMEAQEEIVDTGFTDVYQGWYDVQGCGVCNDYCRWVGRSGSGGDPKTRLAKGDSWWSCQLAGHITTHTNLGRFGSWALERCDGKGAQAPSTPPHLIVEPPPLASN